MENQFVLKDVPEAEVDKVVADFEDEGATVTKEKQSDGKWTVRASLPDYA